MKIIITILSLTLASCSTDHSCTTSPDNLFLETQQCLGLSAPKPDVEFIDFNERGLGKVWAVYIPAHESILVNTGDMGLGFEHTCQTDNEALKHEYVHHILHSNGMGEDSRSHAGWAFSCAPGVNTNN